MIFGAQRDVYDKASLGYKPKEVVYTSIISRKKYITSKSVVISLSYSCKTVKVWILKQLVSDTTKPNIWVPKHLVFISE